MTLELQLKMQAIRAAQYDALMLARQRAKDARQTAVIVQTEIVKPIGPAPEPKQIKRGKSGMVLSMKRDLLERVEFEPDNSRIERQSRGLQTKHLASVGTLLMRGYFNAAAHVMVMEYTNPLDYRFSYPVAVMTVA